MFMEREHGVEHSFFVWNMQFKIGRKYVRDSDRHGHQTTSRTYSNMVTVNEMVRNNC
jgi:hypothetical protein